MVDVNKQVEHWRAGAIDALDTAKILLDKSKIQFGLYFVHLAVEKILKANVSKVTGQVPPKIHNLVRLAEISMLPVDEIQLKLLARINKFNTEGRYGDTNLPQPDSVEIKRIMAETKVIFDWLMNRL